MMRCFPIRQLSRQACWLLCCLPLLGHAADERLRFSGFASFGVAKSLERDELFGESGNTIPYKTEYRDFSKLGLRVTADLHDKLSFTAQMVALGNEDFKPEFDWIFASYNLNPNLVLHVGKYVTSYFMYSDYVDISYAYQWVTAPDAVYNRGINKTLDGAKLVWNARLGSWTSELSLLVGEDESDLSRAGIDSTLNLENGTGFAWQLDRDWLSLRTAYLRSKTTTDLGGSSLDSNLLLPGLAMQLQPVLAAYPGAAASLATALASPTSSTFRDSLDWHSDSAEFLSAGITMNFGPVFIGSEITHTEINDMIAVGPQNSGYLMIGGHLPANVTIAATFYDKRGQVNEDILEDYDDFITAASNEAYATEFANSADPVAAQTAASLTELAMVIYGEALEQTLTAIQKQRRQGVSLSTRWDFHSNAALKVEYLTEINKRYQPGSPNKTTPQAIRVGVDLAF